MSFYDVILAIYPILCFFMVNGAIVAIIIPNDICDTTTTNKHWVAVCCIFAGLIGMRGHIFTSLSILGIMLLGVAYNYGKAWYRNRHQTKLCNPIQPDYLKRVK